ncbi:hypothetical protein HDU92_004999 [Lobulomyces angularis]|nr:hypothetical protein HDU92_004999 [Lobulomyces angularis]
MLQSSNEFHILPQATIQKKRGLSEIVNAVPYEIIENIVKRLNKFDLKSLIYLNKKWSSLALKYFYSSVDLPNDETAELFLDCLKINRVFQQKPRNEDWPMNSLFVKKFAFSCHEAMELRPDYFLLLDAEELESLFRYCKNLKSLKVRNGFKFDEAFHLEDSSLIQKGLKKLKVFELKSLLDLDFFYIFEQFSRSDEKQFSGILPLECLSLNNDRCSARYDGVNLDVCLNSLSNCKNLKILKLKYENIDWKKITQFLKSSGKNLEKIYFEMIGLEYVTDAEYEDVWSNCPLLRDFTYSSYSGSYEVTVEAAEKFKKHCKNLEYIGAYRLNPQVKEKFMQLGCKTR